MKKHIINNEKRTVYIKKNRKIFCFIYNIDSENRIVQFSGTIWKHTYDENPIRRKDIYQTTLKRFNKKPYKIYLNCDIEEGEIFTPLELNFYQFRRIENLLPTFWFEIHNNSKNLNELVISNLCTKSIFKKELTKKEEKRDLRDATRKVLKNALNTANLSINEALFALNEYQKLIEENKKLKISLKESKSCKLV